MLVPLVTIKAMQNIGQLQVLQNVKDLYCKIVNKKDKKQFIKEMRTQKTVKMIIVKNE
jgi:hypothetical protein